MKRKPTHFCSQCGNPEIEVAIRAYMNASDYFACEEGPVEVADGQHISTAYCGRCGKEVGITKKPKTNTLEDSTMSYQETVANNASFNSKKFLKALDLFEDLRWKKIVTESYHTSFGFVHEDKDYLMSIGCGTFYGGRPTYTEQDARSSGKYEVAILDLNPSRANEWATGKFFNHTSEDEEVTRVSKDSLIQLIADLLA